MSEIVASRCVFMFSIEDVYDVTLCLARRIFSPTSTRFISCAHTNTHDVRSARQTRFPFKRNRLHYVRCVNENRKKRKRLRMQQTQAPANRNARSKQWQRWLAACQRKRFRFLRFSFEWKPGFTDVLRNCSYHTRALRHIRPLLTFDAAKTIAHSIVSSRLDYANALLHAHQRVTSTGYRSHRTQWPGRCARLHALPMPPSYVVNFIGCQFANASPTR